MVDSAKFSTFINFGDIASGDTVVGLRDGVNARFTFSTGLVDTISGTANQIDVDSTTPSDPVLSLSSTLDMPGTFTIQSTIALDEIIDDDTLAAATDTNIATAESLKAYIDGLVPSALPSPGSDGTVIIADTAAWITSTVTWPNVFALNDMLYASSASTVTALTKTNNSALSSDATGVPTWIALADGEFAVGSSSGAPAATTITAGTGISVTNAANSITIDGSGGGYSWTEVTGTSQSMSVSNGYIANNVALVTLTLPVSSSVGDTVILQGKGAGGWRLAQNAGQTINFGSTPTTTGVGGYLEFTNQFDSLELVCITANTDWAVLSAPQGSLTTV